MKIKLHQSLALVLALNSPFVFASSAADNLMAAYAKDAPLAFSSERGKQVWDQVGITKKGIKRQCSTCHSKDLAQQGKHYKSGKAIKAMAPSINPKRLIKEKKIKKWLKRNCKWTFGKECTAQQKGDILSYLNTL